MTCENRVQGSKRQISKRCTVLNMAAMVYISDVEDNQIY
jgi:hypothetical protein